MGKDHNDKFEPKEYNDAPFAVAFLVNIVAVIGWVCYASAAGKYHVVQNAADSKKAVAMLQGVHQGVAVAPNAEDSAHYFIILIFMSLFVAIVWAAVWMFLIKMFPVEMTKASLILFPAIFAIATAYALATGGPWIIFAIVTAIIAAIVYFCMWERVEFTAAILKAVVKMYNKAPLVFGLGFGVIVAQAVWMVLWILAVIPLFIEAQNTNSPVSPMIWLFVLSLFWGQQVISNVLYVSCAGVVARFYFGKQQDEAAQKSFGQACTNYFGSICLGSLLIAIIQTLREMCQAAKSAAEDDGNVAMAILACVFDCFLGCLESLVQLFNEFAFVYVAIYGIKFMDAAAKTYDLLTGTDAIINDNIAGVVTLMGSLGVATACAVFNGFSAWRLSLATGYIVGAAVIGFFAGFAIMIVVSRIVEGGTTTMIVAYLEEPDNIDPDLNEQINERRRLKGPYK